MEKNKTKSRKIKRKYLFVFFVLIFVYCAYKYSLPKVFISKEVVEKNIPLKINLYVGEDSRYGDSILVYLPYKFKIQNNRLEKISVDQFYYSQMKDVRNNEQTLYFDDEGNPFGYQDLNSDRQYDLDELLQEKKLFEYLKLKNIGIVFPFSSKIIYYYKSYKLSKNIFLKEMSKDAYAGIPDEFRKVQRIELYHINEYPIQKRIIDSLYNSDKKENLRFTFKTNSKSKFGFYQVKYLLSNDEQTFTDYYNIVKDMNKEELYEFASRPYFEENWESK